VSQQDYHENLEKLIESRRNRLGRGEIKVERQKPGEKGFSDSYHDFRTHKPVPKNERFINVPLPKSFSEKSRISEPETPEHQGNEDEDYQTNRDNLNRSRQEDGGHDKKNMAKGATKYAAKTLAATKGNPTAVVVKISWDIFKQIHWTIDWMILLPLVLAIIKDLLDLIGFSLPGLNEVGNFCVGILTALVLVTLGSNRKHYGVIKGNLKKWFVLIIGVSIEEFFGLNFLPIETITVIICYLLVLLERLFAAEAEKKMGKAELSG
jgi:hypothetical protein